MKTKTYSGFAIFRALLSACILIIPLLSCNFFGIPDYKLTVTVKEGVQGTPANGQHTYKDLTVVDYKYFPVNPLHTVEVIAGSSRLAAENKITVYNNTAIEARLIDIRVIWNMTFLDASGVSQATSQITFSGADILGGTFSDSLGNTGTWDASSNIIKITYNNWEAYKLTGTLFSMSGTWSNGSVTGTWSAVRQQD